MRNASITARELFDQQQEKLGLRWLAGQDGGSRSIESGDTNARRPSLAGYLNAVYPNKVQILGSEELAWLDSLDARLRWETIEKIVQFRPLALVISKNQSCPEDLRTAAEESATPLWISPKRGHELLNHLSYHLARTLAPRVTLHGVFMEIYSIGVLITGEAGSGKSELALELLSRGHRLVADDAPAAWSPTTRPSSPRSPRTCSTAPARNCSRTCWKCAAWACSTCARCSATPR